MGRYNRTIQAETGRTLVALPGFGTVLVSASNPATSSLTRFVNDSGRGLILAEQVTDEAGRMRSRSISLPPGRIHQLPLDAAGPALNRWTVIWTVRPGAMMAGVRISMTITNGPGDQNVVTYVGRDDPAPL